MSRKEMKEEGRREGRNEERLGIMSNTSNSIHSALLLGRKKFWGFNTLYIYDRVCHSVQPFSVHQFD